MLVIPHLILRKKDKILLTRRAKEAKLWAGHWHCVCGKIEHGETPREAIIREAYEEIAITPNSPKLVTTISLAENSILSQGTIFYAVELFFLSELFEDQEPYNNEPLKQDAMEWFSLTELPYPIIPVVKFGLQSFLKGDNYEEFKNV